MKRQRCVSWIHFAVPLCLLQGCANEEATSPVTTSTMAEASDIVVAGSAHGVTPFIELIELAGNDVDLLGSVGFSIEPKPGSASRPVAATYTIAAMRRQGNFTPGSGKATVPVFGLYADFSNHVTLNFEFRDGSERSVAVDVATVAYVDPTGIYDHPLILKSRPVDKLLGFDFFVIKSQSQPISSPVVVDTDGNIRWVGPNVGLAASTAFQNNAFFVGAPDSNTLRRVGLDGSVLQTSLTAPNYTAFHHNIDPGKRGLLVEMNGVIDGVTRDETTLAEVSESGAVLKEWDMARILNGYMLANGDDPSVFVRDGVDWFHMNGATYDRSDDTLVISSRENFLIKLDYETGAVIWIFGDPTKYWYTLASLRAKAVTLTGGGLYPIGQHAPSITSEGLVMVFNDGYGSVHQPPGTSPGESRTYSAVSAYRVDTATLSAQEVWSFDYGQALYSTICSSAYEAPDKSLLLTYSALENQTKARVVGLDADHNVVFDFQYASTGCQTAWNSIQVPFDALKLE